MKIRSGFVSNSSSSSFICDVCGHDESGYDMGLDDAGMYACVGGHTFCKHHTNYDLNSLDVADMRNLLVQAWPQDTQKYANMTDDEIEEEYGDNKYDFLCSVPKVVCPICSMQTVLDKNMNEYLLKLAGKTKKEVIDEIKAKFKMLDDFKKFV